MGNLNDEDNKDKNNDPVKKEPEKELSIEEKLKDTEEKLLRSLAEIEKGLKRKLRKPLILVVLTLQKKIWSY